MLKKCSFLLTLLFLLLPLAVQAHPQQPEAAPRPAQEGESLALPGLDAEVTVHYDAFGVPHIYASTVHDLIMAQGYVQAADRWWQMENFRHLALGRLAEIGGESYLGQDRAFHILGLPRNAAKDLANASPEFQAHLQAFSDGVNAYLDGKSTEELAIQYSYLEAVSGEAFEVEAWEPLHSMAWLQAMAADLALGGLSAELTRYGMAQIGGPLATALFLPGYPYDDMPIITEPGWQPSSDSNFDPAHLSDASSAFPNLEVALNLPVRTQLPGIGSNSWVVSGDLTESGMPLLANDMHLGIQLPAIWYEVGLHCTSISADCPYSVHGLAFSPSPFVIAGHNERLGWGFTNLGTDVVDIYMLDVNEEGQYLYNGDFQDFESLSYVLNVLGGESVEVSVQLSAFGPVINDMVGFNDTPMAFRWAAADGNRTLEAIAQMNRAQNWDEFQAAVTLFDAPAQNIVYADVDGNIGYIASGRIPDRVEGHNGQEPIAGTDDSFAWQGYVDPMDNPRLFNPEAGYVVTANNAAIDPDDFPEIISLNYDFGYRAARLEALMQALAPHNIETMAAMQFDSYNPPATFLVPLLQGIDFEDDALDEAAAWLGAWDYQNWADSSEAVLFNAFWKALMPLVFDELGGAGGGSREVLLLSNIAGTNHVMWQNEELGLREPEAILTLAFEEAYATVTDAYGEDPSAWQWGELHQAVFEVEPFGSWLADGLIPEEERATVEALFVRTVPIGGSGLSPNATGWSASAANFEARGGIPSQRSIMDFSDLDNSRFIIPTGQSADPGSVHFDDQMLMYAQGEYRVSGISQAFVEANAVRTLRLTP